MTLEPHPVSTNTDFFHHTVIGLTKFTQLLYAEVKSKPPYSVLIPGLVIFLHLRPPSQNLVKQIQASHSECLVIKQDIQRLIKLIIFPTFPGPIQCQTGLVVCMPQKLNPSIWNGQIQQLLILEDTNIFVFGRHFQCIKRRKPCFILPRYSIFIILNLFSY